MINEQWRYLVDNENFYMKEILIMENAIELKHIDKSFKGFEIKDLSFSVKKGSITGFIGPNGSGKTTTIKMIMNLIFQDKGTLKIFGLDHTKYEKELKKQIGFVYAENYFYDHLTIQQMKQIIAPFYKKWDEVVFKNYMKTFNLPWKKKIKHLSTGMKMKLSLAIALSHHADLIIMDEPTSGLDPIFRREILDVLSRVIQEENKTILFSTHITTDLEQIADNIVFIYNGRIIFSDAKDTIQEKYSIIKGSSDLLDSDNKSLFVSTRKTPNGFEGLTIESKQVEILMGNQISTEPANLEDIMIFTAMGGEA